MELLFATDFGGMWPMVLIMLILPFVPAFFCTLLWPFARSPTISKRSYYTYIVFTISLWIAGFAVVVFWIW